MKKFASWMVVTALVLQGGLVNAMAPSFPPAPPQDFKVVLSPQGVYATWTPVDGNNTVQLAMDGNPLTIGLERNGSVVGHYWLIELDKPHTFTLVAHSDAGSSEPAVFETNAVSAHQIKITYGGYNNSANRVDLSGGIAGQRGSTGVSHDLSTTLPSRASQNGSFLLPESDVYEQTMHAVFYDPATGTNRWTADCDQVLIPADPVSALKGINALLRVTGDKDHGFACTITLTEVR